jgi:hypothetical protein
MTLAICHLPYNIKRIELQPSREITRLSFLGVYFLRLGEEEDRGAVNKGFILNQRAHRESTVHAASEIRVEGLGSRAEETGQAAAFRDGHLHGVEFGLGESFV